MRFILGNNWGTRILTLTALAFFLQSISAYGQAQTDAVYDPTENSSKLECHIPLRVIQNLEKRYNADLMYGHLFVDSLDGKLNVGIMLEASSSGRRKILLLDSSGEICREWPWINVKEIAHTEEDAFNFRNLDSLIYYAADGQECFLLGDSVTVAENPWFPRNAKKLFQHIPLSYVHEGSPDTNARLPLFRIIKSHVFAATQTGMVYVYNRNTQRLQREVRIEFPVGCTNFADYLSCDCYSDPLIYVLGNSVLIWRINMVVYDQAKRGLLDIPNSQTDFAGTRIGYIKASGDYYGECYFVYGDDIYRFFYTDEGLFVFRFSP